MENITLANGSTMPVLGFGTWQVPEKELELALEQALKAGYRHIDTAAVYENEKAVGRVIKRWIDGSKVQRSELFIVSKLPPTGNKQEGVEKWIKKSLENLQIDYLDLYLVHTPFGFQEVGDDLHPTNENGEIIVDPSTDHLKVWKEMENQVKEGRAKAIGLSNFNIKQISRIMENATIPISSLQIELHLYFQQQEMMDFCKKNKIAVTAYSPLGSPGFVKLLNKTGQHPNILENATVLEIAKHYGKTPAQIALKYILQKGCAAIPKSTNERRIKENIDLFEWTLSKNDIEKLNQLDQGKSARICDFSFLKGIQKHPEFPF